MSDIIKVVMKEEAVKGEALRYLLNDKNISARAVSEHLEIHEGNMSRLLSQGDRWDDFIEDILEYTGIDKDVLERTCGYVRNILTSSNVEIREPETVLDIRISYKQIQDILKKYI